MTAVTARPPMTRQPPRADWPLRDVLPEMGALLTAPKTARSHVRDVLGAWGLPCFEDSAVLIASELVTNVVNQCHDAGGRPVCGSGRLPLFQLSMFTDRARLLIAVWDQVPGVPEQAHPGGNAETGRGLALVAALSHWDWYPVQGGKVVWAMQPKAEREEISARARAARTPAS